MGSISSQVIYSRLSDIFGRKILLIIAITVFTLGNLLCGFAKNLDQLIAFRVVAGLGGGGINVLVLIIVSDISTLRNRGKVCISSVNCLTKVSSSCWSWSCSWRCNWTSAWRRIHSRSHCTTLIRLVTNRFSGDGYFGLLFP
jgi:Sugar (and other) transporter